MIDTTNKATRLFKLLNSAFSALSIHSLLMFKCSVFNESPRQSSMVLSASRAEATNLPVLDFVSQVLPRGRQTPEQVPCLGANSTTDEKLRVPISKTGQTAA